MPAKTQDKTSPRDELPSISSCENSGGGHRTKMVGFWNYLVEIGYFHTLGQMICMICMIYSYFMI